MLLVESVAGRAYCSDNLADRMVDIEGRLPKGYRNGPDLRFLAICTSEELDPLVKYLTTGTDGSVRCTGTLTSSVDYKACVPNHCRYCRFIAAELQSYFGDLSRSMYRKTRH